jgi:hypothetical protein
MSERFDDFAKTVAERRSRRTTLLGLGALALGSLGVRGFGQEAAAKGKNNKCNKCKNKCQRNNKKKNGKNQKNCNNKCNNKCRNKNK